MQRARQLFFTHDIASGSAARTGHPVGSCSAAGSRTVTTTATPAVATESRREARVELTLLTAASQPTTEVLPALGLLSHRVTVLPLDATVLVDRPLGDVILVDARRDLAQVRAFVRVLSAVGAAVPVIAVLTEGGLIAISAEWPVDDIVLDTAGPAELEARLRLAADRRASSTDATPEQVDIGDLTIDETTYTARLSGAALDLTYKELRPVTKGLTPRWTRCRG